MCGQSRNKATPEDNGSSPVEDAETSSPDSPGTATEDEAAAVTKNGTATPNGTSLLYCVWLVRCVLCVIG